MTRVTIKDVIDEVKSRHHASRRSGGISNAPPRIAHESVLITMVIDHLEQITQERQYALEALERLVDGHYHNTAPTDKDWRCAFNTVKQMRDSQP